MVPEVAYKDNFGKMRIHTNICGRDVHFVVITYVLGYNLYGLALFIDLMVLVRLLLFTGVGILVFMILLLEMVLILINI